MIHVEAGVEYAHNDIGTVRAIAPTTRRISPVWEVEIVDGPDKGVIVPVPQPELKELQNV